MIKRDANESEIVAELVNRFNAIVIRLNEATVAGVDNPKTGEAERGGAMDLIVKMIAADGLFAVRFIEIKMPKGKLNDAQELFHPIWNAVLEKEDQIHVCRSLEDVLRVFGRVD